jgi:hypothetical protein
VHFSLPFDIPADAVVSANNYYRRSVDQDALFYKTVYINGQSLDLSNLKVTVTANGVTVILTDWTAADVSGYNLNPSFTGTKVVYQNPILQLDEKEVELATVTLDPQPDFYFDYGYMRFEGDPNGLGLDKDGKRARASGDTGSYSVPAGETLVMSPVRMLIDRQHTLGR